MGSWWIRGSLLGAGAFGQVNLAMDRVTGSLFAVKSTVCYNQGGVDVGAQNSLLAMENEIRMLQGLESEFVVRCLGSDWSEEGGQRMRNVFLEYMPGGSLSDLLKQFAGVQSLDEQLIRSYTRSILQGIDYLHRRGIVHCDIKGKNVLVGGAGTVKLADFGSAKHVDDVELREKLAGETEGAHAVLKRQKLEVELEDCVVRKVNGTPLWMAPEVVLQKEQGFPSDIWSLGCTVVEMATGRAPWAQITDPFVALYRIGCTNEMPAVPASLSPEAHDFLARCFERDPRTRWTSAQLLEHPFVALGGRGRTYSDDSLPGLKLSNTPVSPTSVLARDDGGSNSVVLSSLTNSVPPLSSPRLWKLAAFQFPRAGGAQSDEVGETGCSRSSKDCWGTSPLDPPVEGDWIVVRSPKGKANSNKFESSHEPSDSGKQSDHTSVVVVSAPEEEEEELKDLLLGCSSMSSAHQDFTKHHIQELCKSPPVALLMELKSVSSTPSSPPCFTSFTSSSSLSSFPNARDCVVPEKLSFQALCPISKGMSTSSTWGILLKSRHSNQVQIKPISAADFLHNNPVRDHLQFQKIINRKDCRNYFLSWWLDKIQRARYKHFHTPWISVGEIHNDHLLRRFGIISLEKYLHRFSDDYKSFLRLIQGLLGLLLCNVQFMSSKQPICFKKLSLSKCFYCDTFFCFQLLQESLSLCRQLLVPSNLNSHNWVFGIRSHPNFFFSTF